MCQCKCFYIPPVIINRIASGSNDQASLYARNTSIISQSFRQQRTNHVVGLNTFFDSYKDSTPDILLYDSENSFKLQWKKITLSNPLDSDDEPVRLSYLYADTVRRYLKEVLNRNSIDDLGLDFVMNLHVGKNYMNAFWDGKQMAFGDGDGKVFVNFTKSLDVIAHEMAHGITQHTAGLVYQGQSGALNESFSDCFGSAVQQFFKKQDAGTSDWLVGDEIMGPTLFGEALRSMQAPGSAYDNKLLGRDQQPSHMRDYYSGPQDNGGVHINSGIPNRVFYLTSMTIGTENAMKIWYDAWENRMFPEADFSDFKMAIIETVRLFTRDKKVPLGTTQSIRLAFKEVGL